MRLQSAIFTMDDTLFTPSGQACEALDKALAEFTAAFLKSHA